MEELAYPRSTGTNRRIQQTAKSKQINIICLANKVTSGSLFASSPSPFPSTTALPHSSHNLCSDEAIDSIDEEGAKNVGNGAEEVQRPCDESSVRDRWPLRGATPSSVVMKADESRHDQSGLALAHAHYVGVQVHAPSLRHVNRQSH